MREIPLVNAAPVEPPERRQTAFIMGVGPGLGEALAHRFASDGAHVALAARDLSKLEPLAEVLQKFAKGTVHAYSCDATSDASVKKTMDFIVDELGIPDIAIYCVQASSRGLALDTRTNVVEDYWRQNCLGAFVFARETARSMLQRGRGTIVLMGSTSGLVAREDHVTLAIGKFGLRALAHVLARELGPQGLHVAHLIVDTDIKEGDLDEPGISQSDPAHIADIVCMLHNQPKSAWTSELDVRPFDERFWEHC